ncbi:uncharacterized protein [Lolium perenne]|uniref:uncharacterized protein n=1 Tax=Lolium perenne TaxID=4522 RepID=UPI003A9914E1
MGGAARPQQVFQPAPWYAGQNPWNGVVHAYTMSVPRAPTPGVLGPRPPSHQAYFAAPQPYMQPYGSYMVGQPSQPGGLPPLSPMPPAPWDPALLAALHAAPTPIAYAGGGDWHMDTGASAHMAAHPGTLHTSRPVTTSTRITVGDGSSLPITHIGHASLPSTSTPLSLSNVLVSPNLIKNRVSVKQFTRDNPVTVEFDLFGFSVKDSRTRMVLLRCDSPGDLYLVHSSPSTSTAPVALATGVDLWHARLGHPNPATLRHILRSFSFTCTRRHSLAAGTRLAVHHGRFWTVQPWAAPWLRRCMRLGTCCDPPWSRPLAARLLPVRLRLGVQPVARCTAFGVARPFSPWRGRCPAFGVAHPFGPWRGRGPCRDGADHRPYDAVSDRRSTPPYSGTAPGHWFLGHLAPMSSVASGSFGTRLTPYGTLECYKARWVVRGFRQRAGVDFTETFAPVVKPGTIRTVLQLAVSRGWPVHQMDVSNAFLHGHLTEQVYCDQPTGFVDASHPGHVCLLSRSLYGLKQAPRVWYRRIASFLQTMGFCVTRSDASLFVYHQGDMTAYLLLYVDDIILTASSATLLQQLTLRLRDEFAIKDLGALHYFLGIEVTRRPDGFFLHQQKYAHKLLERAGMLNCHPVATPVDTKAKVSALDGSPASDAPFYRSIVGALQYLTLTRPDLQYAVQQVCLHMHAPRDSHWTLVKRILRYIPRHDASWTHPHSVPLYGDGGLFGC